MAYIGLGSNLGDRKANLMKALRRLDGVEGVRVKRVSSIRETRPVGKTDQPDFLNAVAEIETKLEPGPLLERLLGIERDLGRVRAERWGPRSIDLDLLLYGSKVVRSRRLEVPHPRLKERRFVLEPLSELCPRRVVPGSRRSVGRLLADLEGRA